MYDPFNLVKYDVWSFLIFVEDSYIYINQSYWLLIIYFCSVFVSFWYQTNDGLLELIWEYSLMILFYRIIMAAKHYCI